MGVQLHCHHAPQARSVQSMQPCLAKRRKPRLNTLPLHHYGRQVWLEGAGRRSCLAECCRLRLRARLQSSHDLTPRPVRQARWREARGRHKHGCAARPQHQAWEAWRMTMAPRCCTATCCKWQRCACKVLVPQIVPKVSLMVSPALRLRRMPDMMFCVWYYPYTKARTGF